MDFIMCIFSKYGGVGVLVCLLAYIILNSKIKLEYPRKK